MDPQVLQTIAIAAAVLALLALALAAWAVSRLRHGNTRSVDQRYESVGREVENLRDQHRLLIERADRLERTQLELRDDLARHLDDIGARIGRIDDFGKTDHELQEQIFELREENKVLMGRDDRLERTLQQLQMDLNSLRDGRHMHA